MLWGSVDARLACMMKYHLDRRNFVVMQASLVQSIGMRYLAFSSIIGSVVAAAVLVPELISGWSS
jgi:hypothetical protein